MRVENISSIDTTFNVKTTSIHKDKIDSGQAMQIEVDTLRSCRKL